MDRPRFRLNNPDDHLDGKDRMRLFRRKSENELEAERCPYCREPLPEDATKCMMCGAAVPQASLDELRQPVEAEHRGT